MPALETAPTSPATHDHLTGLPNRHFLRHRIAEAAVAARGRGRRAAVLGLDLDRFHRDEASAAVQQRIDQGKADGQKAGVTGTPTLFVNGTEFRPTGNTYPAISQELRSLLDKDLDL